MSSSSSRDHFDPDDPLYFAPPRLRRGPDFPSAAEGTPDRQPSIPSTSRFDALVEEAIAKSQRPSPGSEIAPDPRAFVFEGDQGRSLLSVASRFAIAIVASAVVAFFFIFMVPMSRRSDTPKLAVTESPAVAATAAPAPADVAPDESRALLQKFMQWQQRDSAGQPAGR